jgi:putative zinc finger protein
MNCEKIKAQLSVYIDGEMSEKDAVAMREHIAACNDCAQAELLLRKTSRLIRSWENIPAPDGFCEVLLAKADNLSRQPRRSIIDAVRPLAGPGVLIKGTVYGAAVLLLCVAVIFFTKLPLKRTPTVEPLPTQTEPVTQNTDDTPQILEDSLTYTTMAEIKVSGIWE